MMRVQVFTPVYRLEPETVAAVLALRWDGPISWVWQRDNPVAAVLGLSEQQQEREVGRVNILHQYEQGRKRFLAGDDDAMLIVESDIIPPPDTLEKLAGLNCDVAYGVYKFRRSTAINIFERYPGQPRNEGESLSLWPQKLARARAAGVTVCSGAGLGCVLVRRHVLQAIPFRLEAGDGGHCDTYWNRDVLRAGFVQKADMTVLCGHKDVDGSVVWPF